MAQEVELKIVPDETAEAIWARIRRLGIAEGRRSTQNLQTAYYDTPDMRLRKAGIALRMRRVGRRWLQTVKARARLEGGLSQAIEVEKPVTAGHLDLDGIAHDETRRAVFEAAADARLAILCETHIQRTRQVLSLGDTRVEFAFDTGTIVAGEAAAPWSEVEFELIEGEPAILFDLAKSIFPSGGLSFSKLNKGARGLRLRETGTVDVPLAPRHAGHPPVGGGDTTEEASSRILADCLEQIAVNAEVVRAMDDPDGPHQLRVGLRRLRSFLKISRPVLDGDEMRRLDAEAKWLASVTGSLRDIEACAQDILAPEILAHPGEQGLEALRSRLEAQAADVRAELRRTLVSERAQAFLFDLARAVATRGWRRPGDETRAALLARPAAEFAVEALAASWKKAARLGRDIDMLDVERKHDLRKALKAHRYAIEFLHGCFPRKRVKSYLKDLKDMLEILGDLNDAATARTLLSDPRLADPQSPQDQRSVGWILGATQARSEYGWQDAKKLWRNLRKADRFWLADG